MIGCAGDLDGICANLCTIDVAAQPTYSDFHHPSKIHDGTTGEVLDQFCCCCHPHPIACVVVPTPGENGVFDDTVSELGGPKELNNVLEVRSDRILANSGKADDDDDYHGEGFSTAEPSMACEYLPIAVKGDVGSSSGINQLYDKQHRHRRDYSHYVSNNNKNTTLTDTLNHNPVNDGLAEIRRQPQQQQRRRRGLMSIIPYNKRNRTTKFSSHKESTGSTRPSQES